MKPFNVILRWFPLLFKIALGAFLMFFVFGCKKPKNTTIDFKLIEGTQCEIEVFEYADANPNTNPTIHNEGKHSAPFTMSLPAIADHTYLFQFASKLGPRREAAIIIRGRTVAHGDADLIRYTVTTKDTK